MKLKTIATTSLVLTMAIGRAGTAFADNSGLVGGIIGGIIGGAIVNEANKSHRRTTTTTTHRKAKPTGISSAQREANLEVQVALNEFGYPVGTPDGSLGPKSRSAISEYQVLIGYPPTGQLTEYERTLLVTAYHRAVAGGPLVAQTVATHPMGMRGLLLVQRDEMAGIVPAQPAAAGVLAAAPPVQPDAPAAVLPSLVAEAPAADPAALPSFMADSSTKVSLASQCNKVSLVTNTNGGYTTAASMTDPMFALSEQFCLARTYAMASGEDLAAKATAFTPAQISEQCQAFGPVLKDQVAALSLQPRDQVLQGVQAFILKSGMSPAQLSGTAKVCLGVGYTTDNMDVAIASALLLTALGEGAYGELLGHHLSQGFGANVRPDLALDWYDTGLAAMGAGAAIFAPGIADRPDVIRKAAFTIGGRAEVVTPALPQFAADPAAEPAPEVVAVAPTPEVVLPAVPEKNVASTVAPAAEGPATVALDDTTQPTAPAPAAGLMPSSGGQVVLMAARLPFLLFGK